MPKISEKSIGGGESEIIRSELGVFNILDILRQKQSLEEPRKPSRVRVTSMIEEDY